MGLGLGFGFDRPAAPIDHVVWETADAARRRAVAARAIDRHVRPHTHGLPHLVGVVVGVWIRARASFRVRACRTVPRRSARC